MRGGNQDHRPLPPHHCDPRQNWERKSEKENKNKTKMNSNTTINNMSMLKSNDAILNGSQSFMFQYAALAATLAALDSDSDDEDNDGPKPKRQRRMKSRFTREDQADSVFSVLYLKPFDDHRNENNNENNNKNNNENDNVIDLMDNTNDKAIAFRSDFRVPYVEFVSMCDYFQERNKKMDATGCPGVDCRLLVLSSLRLLAWGPPLKSLEELTCVHRETHRQFFLNQFLSWGCRLARDNIYLPRDDTEYAAVESVYRKKGLPGCVGSIDCVHVQWDRCPSGFKGECKGKDSKPTLAFEVVCAHNGRVQSVSTYNPGANNDKTIAQNDEAVHQVRNNNTFLSNKTFETRCNDGTMRTHLGSYYICDGGYCNWTLLIPPFKDQIETSQYYGWSKHVEGLRKDIECVFGKLKKRFLAIKNPICFANPHDIERMFLTCCAVHNALLAYDNPNDDDVFESDDTRDENDEETEIEEDTADGSNGSSTAIRFSTDRDFHDRRIALVNHYNISVAQRTLDLD